MNVHACNGTAVNYTTIGPTPLGVKVHFGESRLDLH